MLATPSQTLDLRLPGQWYASESALHQNWMRDYDPITGRYIEVDPLGIEAGANLYPYVNSDPLNLTDPMGEIIPLVPIIIGGLGGAGFDIGLQGLKLYLKGCDPFDYRNYDKTDILVSGLFGAAFQGPMGVAFKSFKEYRALDGAPYGLNRGLYQNLRDKFFRRAAGQAARGAAAAAAKNAANGGFDDQQDNSRCYRSRHLIPYSKIILLYISPLWRLLGHRGGHRNFNSVFHSV